MARDFQQELIDIEIRKQANNEVNRTDGAAERNRLRDAMEQLPADDPQRAQYQSKIKLSQAREEDLVNSNNRTAHARTNEVERDQLAEQEAAKGNLEIVAPPQAPVNDNNPDPQSILHVAPPTPEPTPPPTPEPTQPPVEQSDASGLNAIDMAMAAVNLLNIVNATALHPMGPENPSLLEQPPAYERQVSGEELRAGVAEIPPTAGSDSQWAQSATPETKSLLDTLADFDKTVHSFTDTFVPPEQTPKSRMDSALEESATANQALDHAAQHSKSPSGDGLNPSAADGKSAQTPETSAAIQGSATFGTPSAQFELKEAPTQAPEPPVQTATYTVEQQP